MTQPTDSLSETIEICDVCELQLMKTVIIESPYSGAVERNIGYAIKAALDCINKGESPFVSHLFYTQFLNDKGSREHLRD